MRCRRCRRFRRTSSSRFRCPPFPPSPPVATACSLGYALPALPPLPPVLPPLPPVPPFALGRHPAQIGVAAVSHGSAGAVVLAAGTAFQHRRRPRPCCCPVEAFLPFSTSPAVAGRGDPALPPAPRMRRSVPPGAAGAAAHPGHHCPSGLLTLPPRRPVRCLCSRRRRRNPRAKPPDVLVLPGAVGSAVADLQLFVAVVQLGQMVLAISAGGAIGNRLRPVSRGHLSAGAARRTRVPGRSCPPLSAVAAFFLRCPGSAAARGSAESACSTDREAVAAVAARRCLCWCCHLLPFPACPGGSAATAVAIVSDPPAPPFAARTVRTA